MTHEQLDREIRDAERRLNVLHLQARAFEIGREFTALGDHEPKVKAVEAELAALREQRNPSPATLAEHTRQREAKAQERRDMAEHMQRRYNLELGVRRR